MPASEFRVQKQLELLRKKHRLLKCIIQAKQDWKIKEHLFNQNVGTLRAEFEALVQKEKIKAMGTSSRPQKKKKKKSKKRRWESDAFDEIQPQGVATYSEDEIETSDDFEERPKAFRVISMLMKMDISRPFLQPVDPVRDGARDYFTVIKTPMDFGTIKDELKNNKITDFEEFKAKVYLVFRNARTYNPPSNIVHQHANRLEQIFERKLVSIDRNQAQEIKKEREEALKLQREREMNYAKEKQKEKRLEYVERKSKEQKYFIPETESPTEQAAKRRKGNPFAGKEPRQKHMAIPEVFDDEEKEKLRSMILDMTSVKLEGVLRIMGIEETEGNIDLDLDSMNREDLIELYIYCKKQTTWAVHRPHEEQRKRNNLEREIHKLKHGDKPMPVKKKPKPAVLRPVDTSPAPTRNVVRTVQPTPNIVPPPPPQPQWSHPQMPQMLPQQLFRPQPALRPHLPLRSHPGHPQQVPQMPMLTPQQQHRHLPMNQYGAFLHPMLRLNQFHQRTF